MQHKKFVKSQMFASDNKFPEKPQKFQKYNNQTTQRPKRTNRQYTEKVDVIDLRKYFEIVPASENSKIRDLIVKFPNFFYQISTNLEPAPSRYQGRSQNTIEQKDPYEQDKCDWDSDGEIDLGVGVIDKTQFKKYLTTAPLKTNQLKRHQKQFLQDQLRIKENHHKQQKSSEEKELSTKKVQKAQAPQKQITKAEVKQDRTDSDDQIQIQKTTQYEIRPQKEQINVHQSSSSQEQKIQTQSQGSRFNDSEESEDIFGNSDDQDADNTQSKQSQGSVVKVSNGKGCVEFAKGQFGVFSLSQNLKPDDEVWTFSSGNTQVSKKFSSTEMDKDYKLNHHQQYPLIAFDKYPIFVPYVTFSQHPRVQLFMPQNNQINNNYDHKYNHGKSNKRKYSNYQQEDNKQRNRRQSTMQYRPKNDEHS